MSAKVLSFPHMPLPPDAPMPNRLRHWRRRNGMTLDQAAPAIGITRVHLQRLEVGTRELTMPVMERAADFYGCMVADLLNPEHGGLNDDERTLVQTYREVPGHSRQALRAVAESQQAWRSAPEVTPFDPARRAR